MRWGFGVLSLIVIGGTVHSPQEFRSRYHLVESYEIRPGVLATPTYAESGMLCEVSIEKRHVNGDTVDLGSTIPRKESLEIIDELAPPYERGKAIIQWGGFDYIDEISGSMAVATADYQDVSVQIFRTRSDPGDTAVILKWKNACEPSSNDKHIP